MKRGTHSLWGIGLLCLLHHRLILAEISSMDLRDTLSSSLIIQAGSEHLRPQMQSCTIM